MTILTNEINVCELSKENKKIKKKRRNNTELSGMYCKI